MKCLILEVSKGDGDLFEYSLLGPEGRCIVNVKGKEHEECLRRIGDPTGRMVEYEPRKYVRVLW